MCIRVDLKKKKKKETGVHTESSDKFKGNEMDTHSLWQGKVNT